MFIVPSGSFTERATLLAVARYSPALLKLEVPSEVEEGGVDSVEVSTCWGASFCTPPSAPACAVSPSPCVSLGGISVLDSLPSPPEAVPAVSAPVAGLTVSAGGGNFI